MRHFKRALVVFMAMVLTMMTCMPVMASVPKREPQNSEKVTVTFTPTDGAGVSLKKHTFAAYQIFSGTQQTDPSKLPNDGSNVLRLGDVKWGDNINAENFLAALKGINVADPKFVGSSKLAENPFTGATTAQQVADALKDFAGTEDLAELRFLDEVARLALENRAVDENGEKLPPKKIFNFTENEILNEEMPIGYYLIVDETKLGENGLPSDDVLNAVLLQLTTNIVINVKTTKPDLSKEIDGGYTVGEDPDTVYYNDVAVGDTVDFTLRTKVPNLSHFRTYKFVVVDQLSKGLTFQEDSVKVYVGDLTTPIDKANYELSVTPEDPVLTDEYAGGTSLKIVFKDFYDKWLEGTYNSEDDIVIKYSAILNDDANIGEDPNPNRARLQYWQNPNTMGTGDPDNDDFNPDDPKGETPWDVTYTFSTGLKLTKVDGENTNMSLSGAIFKVTGEKLREEVIVGWNFAEATDGEYYKLKTGEYTKDAPTDDNSDLYESVETKYSKVSAKHTTDSDTGEGAEGIQIELEVSENGVLYVAGLSEGTYYFEELQAPLGYNKLTQRVKIVISKPDLNIGDGGVVTCDWKVAEMSYVDAEGNETPADSLEFSNSIDTYFGGFAFNVANNQGALLPRTGGIGTTIFYVVGGMLVVVAAVLLVLKRRASQKED